MPQEGSSGGHFQDSSVEYGQFPSAPELPYQRKNIQSCKNPTSEEGDLSEREFFSKHLKLFCV